VSRQNIELHRRFYEAFNTRDIEAMIELCHPEIEFYSRFVELGGVSVFRGHNGMRDWNRGFEDVWAGDVHITPETYFDLGDRTLAFATMYARGRQSGLETTMKLFQPLWWKEGLCTVLKSCSSEDEALAELGISAHDLGRPER
jgi:ketosteroid isomerase-like protein